VKFFFETYGCQMNLAESAALALAARERGWEEADSGAEADLVLINTCSVRATAEQRVFGRLAHYKALKKLRPAKAFTLAVAGCMAQRLGEKLKENGADFVMGTSSRSRFPLILEAVERGASPDFTETDEKFEFSSLHFDGHGGGGESPYRAFVPIMHGCNNFCSYCIVPYVRGREVSRGPEAILGEIRLLEARGCREITLLGQNVNSYSWEGPPCKTDFPALLELIAKNIDTAKTAKTGIRRVRFLSSHPKDFSADAIRIMAQNPLFCRHIHLPVQHGSNRVLKAMNRQYTRESYLELVSRLRSALPGLSLSTDILAGFPGETEEDFEEVLSLMEEVKFLYAYMYLYNPREGTAAYTLPDRVSREASGKRLSRVIELQKRHTAELLKGRLGKDATVLIEGISRKNADELVCRTERDEMAVVPGSPALLGSFAELNLSSLSGNTFRAKKVTDTF
jgi:tRNA-2-methylthio-N6-dimethylallyladenosine synthase